MTYMTKKDFAKKWNVSLPYISKLLRLGKLKQSPSGKINIKICDPIMELETNSLKNKKTQEVDGSVKKTKAARSNEEYWEAKKRKENILADKAELELAIKRKQYVKIELVNNALMVKGLAVRQAIEAIPNRISGRLVGKDVLEINNILTKENDAALYELTKELVVDDG